MSENRRSPDSTDSDTEVCGGSQPTPGPWDVRHVSYLFKGAVIDGWDGNTWEIDDQDGSWWIAHALTEPNARLIAAAPDLLQALKEATCWLRGTGKTAAESGCHCETLHEVQTLIWAAIAKAEGK